MIRHILLDDAAATAVVEVDVAGIVDIVVVVKVVHFLQLSLLTRKNWLKVNIRESLSVFSNKCKCRSTDMDPLILHRKAEKSVYSFLLNRIASFKVELPS